MEKELVELVKTEAKKMNVEQVVNDTLYSDIDCDLALVTQDIKNLVELALHMAIIGPHGVTIKID